MKQIKEKDIVLDEKIVIKNIDNKKKEKQLLDKYKKIFHNKYNEIKLTNGKTMIEFPNLEKTYYNGHFYDEKYIKCYQYFKDEYYSDEEIAEMLNVPIDFIQNLVKNGLTYSEKTQKVGMIKNGIKNK